MHSSAQSCSPCSYSTRSVSADRRSSLSVIVIESGSGGWRCAASNLVNIFKLFAPARCSRDLLAQRTLRIFVHGWPQADKPRLGSTLAVWSRFQLCSLALPFSDFNCERGSLSRKFRPEKRSRGLRLHADGPPRLRVAAHLPAHLHLTLPVSVARKAHVRARSAPPPRVQWPIFMRRDRISFLLARCGTAPRSCMASRLQARQLGATAFT